MLLLTIVYLRKFNKIITFGDSLSDGGNMFQITGKPPTGPQNHRFTNKYVWSEYLCEKYFGVAPLIPKVRISAQRFLSSINSSNCPNQAFGGCQAYNNALKNLSKKWYKESSSMVESIKGHVEHQIFSNVLDTNKKDNLQLIWIGSNDQWDRTSSPDDKFISNVVNEILKVINRLTRWGASNFIVLGNPSIGLTPGIKALGLSQVKKMTSWMDAHNKKLKTSLDVFKTNNKGIKLLQFDPQVMMEEIYFTNKYNGITIKVNKNYPCVCMGDFLSISNCNYKTLDYKITKDNIRLKTASFKQTKIQTFNYAKYLTNILNNNIPIAKICKNPNEFLFFDEAHPTEKVHKMLAEKIYKLAETFF